MATAETVSLSVAARRLGVTPERARQMVLEGKLAGFQAGPKGWWKVTAASVEAAIHRRGGPGPKENSKP